MTLIKWNRDLERPYQNMDMELARPLKSMLDKFFGGDISDYLGDYRGTVPSINVKETKDEINIEVAAPGMDKGDFNITLENDYLVISGEKKENKEEKDQDYTRKEFNYESFQRSFYLPKDMVKADKIDAKYKDGILNITVPKTEEAKKIEPKHIEIS